MKSAHGFYYYYYFYQNVSSHVIIIILLLIFTQSINYIESYQHHRHHQHHHNYEQQQHDEPMKIDSTINYNTDDQQLTISSPSNSNRDEDNNNQLTSSSSSDDVDLNSYTNGLPEFTDLNPSSSLSSSSSSSSLSYSSLESTSISPISTILNLQGTFNSFAQFKSWIINRNQHQSSSQLQLPNLSLSIRTHEPNSLIFYSQSSDCCDYMELKLVEGVLRLRFNLTSGSSVISIGRNLHDYQWHLIEIIISKESLMLKIDGETSIRSLRPSADHQHEKSTKMDYLFIGGFPVNSYPSEFVNLHLPWILFEPTYRGQIKNIIYQSEDDNNLITGSSSINHHRQEPIKWNGLRRDTSEPCSDSDPCNHGGTCINTDSGAECDCRGLDYIGDHCDKPKHSPEATFRGQEFIYFNNISKSILSSSDEISLYFKSRQSNGLLFYAGDGISDYLNLAIRDGGVTLSVKLGNNLSERIVKPARIRFDDNQWHKVLVHRKVREMNRAISFCHFSITIDGVYTERGSTTGSFSLLSSSILFIGGSDHFEQLPGSRVQSNFIGCLRKVEFIGDSMVLDILDLAKSDLNLLQVKGNIVDSCQEVEAADPITFTTKDSFLALPRWEAIKGGSLSLKIRTNEPSGVLMYSSGKTNGNSYSTPSVLSSSSLSFSSSSSNSGSISNQPPSDFFALELLDGQIYLLLNLGSGPIKVKASARRVDDSHWHVITLLRTAKSGRVTVDDAAVDFVTPGTNNQLDLESPLYLGSFGPSLSKAFNEVPPELWAGSLKYGYVGCVRDLVLNNQAIDIASFARKQDSGSVKPSCHSLPSHCDKKPCFNEGICMEGWNRFVCDCRATSYTGPVCTKDATTLNFNGEDYMLIDLGEEVTTQAEDLNLRFKTTTSTSFLLMASSADRFSSYLIISLENGRLKVTINLGEGNKITYIGNGLGNDRWHTIRIHRRGPSLEVKCDSDNVITELTGQLINLHYSNLVIGSYIDLRPGAVRPSTMSTSTGHNKEAPNFIGSMQNLILNGNDYIDLSRQGIDLNFTVTATYGKKDGSVHRPITFKSRRTYIGLPQLKAYSTMALYFQFKTNLPNGLILFNGGKDDDFIAIELVAGQLHYTFNMGDGPRRVKSSTRYSLNDGQWHSVAVGRPSLGQHTLMVDDMVSSFTNNGPNLHLDLTGLLYLGGLPSEMYSTLPSLVVSNHGFEGCLASLDFNGETIDPTGSDAVVRSTLVSKGCSGEGSVECSPGSKEDGSCDSLIPLGSPVTCIPTDDCPCDDNQSPSSLLPNKCSYSLGSASYKWGSKGGLILFTFPDKKLDTKNDHISITFSTESDNCVLFRVDSGSSNDYMELSIFDGTILMVYNLGTEDHDIGQLDVKVNDGKVHSVRFTRIGPNSTIQVDNHNLVRKTPSGGRQLTVFNSHHKIQIGGKMNTAKETLEKPFTGIISGLLYNGYRLLDLAMETDPRIEVKGDVLLVTSTGKSSHKESRDKLESQNQKENLGENSSSNKENTDSLIFSGEGSGDCFDGNDDDDDGCEIKTVKETEIDELITPKLVEMSVKPTQSTWTSDPRSSWSSVTTESSASRPCKSDVEDCSGSNLNLPNPPISSTIGLTREITSTSSPQTLDRSSTPTSTSIFPWTESVERSTYGWYKHETSTLNPSKLYPKISSPIQYPPMRPKPQTPTRPTGRPPIIDVPIPSKPYLPMDKPNHPTTINQQEKPKAKTSGPSADNTALLIGLVAITLIIIVVLTPMIFYSYIRYQNERYYKEHPVNGSMISNDLNRVKFNPVTGVPTIITNEVDLDGSNMYHGSSRSNVSHILSPETAKNSKKKDNREWYV